MNVETPWYEIENIAELPSPSLLIYPDRIEENLRRMIALAGHVDRLRPHVKTHKLPQVVRMKLAAGISKFKTSTIAEAEMTAAAGGNDVLIAYPLVGPNIARFVALQQAFPQVRFAALIDHPAMVAAWQHAAEQAGHGLRLYLDINVGMDRTGHPCDERAEALYRELVRTPGLIVEGIHAYDGHLINQDVVSLKQQVDLAFTPVWSLRDRLQRSGVPVPRVITSGTPTFPQFGDIDCVEVGCGTTVLWDVGQAEACPDLSFLNAAVLVTRVVSVPSPGVVCVDLGHKAVAAEMPQPRVSFLNLEMTKVLRHSEEHLVVATPRTDLLPGDVIYAVPRHICPTVALHQEVWPVHASRVSTPWPVVARARRLTV